MRKIVMVFFCLLTILGFYGYNANACKCKPEREFEFRSGFSKENPSGRFVESGVVVNRNWDDPTLPERIVEDYIKINGKPTTLKLSLFYSNWHKKQGEAYLTLEYDYRQ